MFIFFTHFQLKKYCTYFRFLLYLFSPVIVYCKNDTFERSTAHFLSADKGSIEKYCQADTFKIAFYNLENFFDFEYDGTEYPEYIPGMSSWTREVQLIKINAMAEVITKLDADIIGLCEIEDDDALGDLTKGLKRLKKKYDYQAIRVADVRTATTNALLSRYPLRNIETHPVNCGGGFKTREILEADVEICGRILKIFVNHWPSKLNPESFRVCAARVLASRLQELPLSTEYILIGDFNSDYNEFQTFVSTDLNNSNNITGFNHHLGTVLFGDTVDQYISKKSILNTEKRMHYDLWLELPEKKRMSYVFRGNKQTPDHFLIPAALLDSKSFSYLDNSFNVFTLDSKLLKDGKPYRWQYQWVKKQKIHIGKGYSDHLPVYAQFTNLPFRKDTATDHGSIPAIMSRSKGKSGEDASLMIINGGFEGSTEGWISCRNEVTVERDSSIASKGKWSLKISGSAMNANNTVARTVLLSKNKSCQLDYRGTGKISFRVRNPGGEWTYYNGPDFKSSHQARYRTTIGESWKNIKFKYNTKSTNTIELEIRAAKKTSFVCWIDNVY